jgi:hypothetical protein
MANFALEKLAIQIGGNQEQGDWPLSRHAGRD